MTISSKTRHPVPPTQQGIELKRFFKHFNSEQHALLPHIQGLPSESLRSDFAQLMLKRLMLLAFLQHHCRLDSNPDYLAHYWQLFRETSPQQNFYQDFLLPLQHRLSQSSPSTASTPLMGSVPALNLPFFRAHPIELAHPSIQVANAAFDQLFDFLSSYGWHICEPDLSIPCYPSTASPILSGNTLNPSIFAALFEQRTNQKHMGAYYTSTDVTHYIACNTILPYLLTAMQRTHPSAFAPTSPFWQLLATSPDRFIPSPLRSTLYHPQESRREYYQRQARSTLLRYILHSGFITSIYDCVTHHLDLFTLTIDALNQCTDPDFLSAFYALLQNTTILDPTCGTGAFLMAALSILEALYSCCLSRLKTLSPSLSSSCCSRASILETILSHNLYGVDVMDEAVEICQLRLQLVLINGFQDPTLMPTFPSLNDHILAGNALVGFIHAPVSSQVPPLNSDTLDRHLASSSLIDPASFSNDANYQQALHQWQADHRPFHWCLAFSDIIARGGFSVIIGNPPYIEYSKVRQQYRVPGYESESCGNLYAAVIERSLALCNPSSSFFGLVVPLSICSSERFSHLRQTILASTAARWFANFEIFPCRLFPGAFQRLSILLAHAAHSNSAPPSPAPLSISQSSDSVSPSTTFVTRLQRWYSAERPHLIDLLSFTPTYPLGSQTDPRPGSIPKLASPVHTTILQKIAQQADGHSIASVLLHQPSEHFIFYQEATNYWTKAVCHIPFYRKNGILRHPPHGRFLFFSNEDTARTIMALMNSSLFYLWFATYSDGFHLSHALVKDFPTGPSLFSLPALVHLALLLESDILLHAQKSTRNPRSPSSNTTSATIDLAEYRLNRSKPLLDKIDAILASHFHLSKDELAFVVNYDIKYRLGRTTL